MQHATYSIRAIARPRNTSPETDVTACCTPFNKAAMRASRLRRRDRLLGRSARDHGPASEFNILDGLWNARVTSHVPLSAFTGAITRERVAAAIRPTDRSLREANVPPQGSPSRFWSNPLVATLCALALLLLCWPTIAARLRMLMPRRPADAFED